MRLTLNQRKQFADILGNIAVAWFAAGIISPLFSATKGIEALYYLVFGVLMTGVFVFLSLSFVKGRAV